MTTLDELQPIRSALELLTEDPALVELPGAGDGAPAPIVAAGRDGPALVVIPGRIDDATLAQLRDDCWPDCHFLAVFRIDENGAIERATSQGGAAIDGNIPGPARTIIYTRTREDALGQTNTVIKFDLRASAWNGAPGSPTYGHYRWMRRLIAVVAEPTPGLRTLDAGCGTGWVGIEAARLGAMVSAFDPSSAMVDLARENATETGVDLDARVGFVEDVPFDRPFQLVLNSGVISFAPDAGRYLDSLDRLVEPGGLLVIGDINPLSRGFRRRRSGNPLLPARELNGLPRECVAAMLTKRGYSVEGGWFYQLSFPVPELMALSEQKLAGLGCGALLGLNRLATRVDRMFGARGARQFDSWILRARKGS